MYLPSERYPVNIEEELANILQNHHRHPAHLLFPVIIIQRVTIHSNFLRRTHKLDEYYHSKAQLIHCPFSLIHHHHRQRWRILKPFLPMYRGFFLSSLNGNFRSSSLLPTPRRLGSSFSIGSPLCLVSQPIYNAVL